MPRMPSQTPEGESFYGYGPAEGRQATQKTPGVDRLNGPGSIPVETVNPQQETELALEAQRAVEVTPDNWQERKAAGFEALYGFELGSTREKAEQGATIRRLEERLGSENVLVGTEYDEQSHRPRPRDDSDRARSVYVRIPAEMAA